MSDSRLKHELRCLVLLSLEGEATEQQYQRLNELLKSSQEYFNYYLDLIEIHQAIQSCNWQIEYENVYSLNRALEEFAIYENNAPEIEITQEEPPKELIQKVVYPPREKVRMTKFQKFTLAASAAIVFFFAYLSLIPQKSYSVKVATLTDSINASWADNVSSMHTGARLFNDSEKLMLREGVAELTFDNKTTAVIEAPAEFQILADDRIGLTYGKVYVTVLPEAVGFSVYTPNAKIIDFGTEFGVHADVNGNTQLSVLKGKILLVAGEVEKRKKEVIAGTSKKISSETGEITDVEFQSDYFIRVINSESNTVWRGQSLDLSDMIGGGNGFGTGQQRSGIDPSTGRLTSKLRTIDKRPGKKGYSIVPEHLYIDGVFVPDGSEHSTFVSSHGHVFSECPNTDFQFWAEISNYPWVGSAMGYTDMHLARINGKEYGNKQHPAIFMHANTGITFDLDAIRDSFENAKIKRFHAIGGISDTSYMSRKSVLWVLLDGKVQDSVHLTKNDDSVDEKTYKMFGVDISEDDRFLSLVATDGGDGISGDWTLFGNPVLELE